VAGEGWSVDCDHNQDGEVEDEESKEIALELDPGDTDREASERVDEADA